MTWALRMRDRTETGNLRRDSFHSEQMKEFVRRAAA